MRNEPAFARSVVAVFLSVDKDLAGRIFASKSRRWAAVAKKAGARMLIGEDDAFGHDELERHGVGIGRLGLDGRMLTPSELEELVESPSSLQRFPREIAKFLKTASKAKNALFVLERRVAETVASELLPWGPPSEPVAIAKPEPIANLPRRLSSILRELSRWKDESVVTWKLEKGNPNCLVIKTTHANTTSRKFLTDEEVDLLARALESLGKTLDG